MTLAEAGKYGTLNEYAFFDKVYLMLVLYGVAIGQIMVIVVSSVLWILIKFYSVN